MTDSISHTLAKDWLKKGFEVLTGFPLMCWQERLLYEHFLPGDLPSAVSIPTGLGKTAVVAVWLVSLAWQLKIRTAITLPRRLVYVVDRRAVVDQATTFVTAVRERLQKPEGLQLREALGLSERGLPISTLRGQYVDNREWLEDPSLPAIIVGTVDMVGSRLLFEGYGVSRKMRPYHAGLLGTDTLVLLDEAHLVPPFEALLTEIAGNRHRYGPDNSDLGKLVPTFALLPLSATGRRRAKPFVLVESDFRNPDDTLAIERLSAKKRLTLNELGDNKLGDALASHAWNLSENGTKPIRCIVYCNSRDIAEKVKAQLDNKLGKTSAEGNAELFVGARRVRERIEAEQRLKDLGFLASEREKQDLPAFLVATSAGEVGVDLDADHMVCDLVAWERMVQRLGRVNRRGGLDRQATIVVFIEPEPKPKKQTAAALDKTEAGCSDKERQAIAEYDKQLAEFRSRRLPFGTALPAHGDGSFDVSPEALRQLSERAHRDERLSRIIAEASSSVPLRPALNRALVDAWSMTSLPEHTGRPEVDPWLRGWISDDEPQTRVVWRRYLPVRRSEPPVSRREVEEFFEAAPVHASEILETETRRVLDWLQKRAAAKLRSTPGGYAAQRLEEAEMDVETSAAIGDAENAAESATEQQERWRLDDVIGILLGHDGTLARTLRLRDIPSAKDASASNKRAKALQELRESLYGKMLVIGARFGGLCHGLLNHEVDDDPLSADGDTPWNVTDTAIPVIRFRIRDCQSEDGGAMDDWIESLRFDLERSADGSAARWLSIEKWRDTSNTENDRAAGRPQSLTEHQSWTARQAEAIGERLRLPAEYIRTLVIAARLHDEGKKAPCWQRAFRASRDAAWLGIPNEPLAKTRGPINLAVLGDYRHEFGSLPHAEEDAEFNKLRETSPGLADLVLHIIAAHHGFARPLIRTDGCEDAPSSALKERAREVALRFGRLQKRWGPWGLAWWETLLRAADTQASRANDEAVRKQENG